MEARQNLDVADKVMWRIQTGHGTHEPVVLSRCPFLLELVVYLLAVADQIEAHLVDRKSAMSNLEHFMIAGDLFQDFPGEIYPIIVVERNAWV